MSPDQLTHLIIVYRYWIVIPLSFLEGPIVAFAAGALASLGYFNLFILFTIFFLRDVILDGIFYFLGRFAGQTSVAKRFLLKIGISPDHIAEIQLLWNTHGGATMFFSKLSYGLSSAFLIIAGIVRMPIAKFFEYAALVAIAQYGVLLLIGFYFGNSFGTVSGFINNIQYAVLGITVFGTAYYFFKYYMRHRLLQAKNAT